jgi:hypothetical protein
MTLPSKRRHVTPLLQAHVPPELIAAARRALGIPDSAPTATVVRTALATSAGVSLDAYPLAKRGPKPGGRNRWHRKDETA